MHKRLFTTPKIDGYRMPGEFEAQAKVFMIWPERPDSWRDAAIHAQAAYANVARAIADFTPVTMLASAAQLERARMALGGFPGIAVIEAESNDAWIRDCGPTFVTNGQGGIRAIDWDFNAWGGDFDGLYSSWDLDDRIPRKIAEIEDLDFYSTTGFVLEGGSIHVDGEGTVLTTEMCLLSEGRNPQLSKVQIEDMLKEYLNAEKVIWLKDGIDPEETNGHVDDVACFARPGEVVCLWCEDPADPFYEVSRAAYETLCGSTDAKGRPLKVHKLTSTARPVLIGEDFRYTSGPKNTPRSAGEICIASYVNFLITNGGVIVPQYGDANDALATVQLRAVFPEREVVGVMTREIVYGGGNIHCITQQMPSLERTRNAVNK